MVMRSHKVRPRRVANPLAEALRTCRFAFGIVAVFSLVMNLLMLAVPLYMLQIYDRVLTTGRVETLTMLTGMALGALVILGVLDALRGAVLARLGCWFSTRLAPVFLSSDGLTATLDPYGTSTTRLTKNTRYRAVVNTGAMDLAGNALDQNATISGALLKAWFFTTGG